MATKSFFSGQDVQIAQAYVEGEFGIGAFDPVVGTTEPRDEIALASIASARDYFQQSEGTRSSSGQSFRVFPGMANVMAPNAFAAKSDELHLCCIHVGLHVMIFETACFVMTQQDAFTEVGGPQKETSPTYPADAMPAFWLIDQTVAQGTVSATPFADALVPKCPERYLFAVHLTLLMLRYVWFHELFHCLNGHVGYLARHNENIRLNEIAALQNPGIVEIEGEDFPLPKARLLQALELDADRSAIYAAYRTQLHDKENIIGIAERKRQQRCEMALLAAVLVTFIIEQINQRTGRLKVQTHPTGYTRLHDVLRTTASHLQPVDPNITKLFQSLLQQLRLLRRSALPGLPDPDRLLTDLENAEFQAELDVHENDLNVARNRFQPFGYR